ncbi:glycosyltransferase [candidate division KSB1 bacterium]|nr:MAG: glycosyltransferase [candidate division KSB1 bacterium]MCE7944603.1 glycosyltransferase [Chlorobi bacterium CHB1]MDL1875639.1 glycosyltransferase [Cytophagia bacterium CHB2]RIK70199.1 MAG: glycosyltransferase [candidate division KSB1 bacterium]
MQVIAADTATREDRILIDNNDPVFVSIVVPTLNEAANICSLVQPLRKFPEAEIIFADGGSCDGTQRAIASQNTGGKIRLVHAPCSRARQMNAGAKVAGGEWLIFLHADTILPARSLQNFLRFVRANPQLAAGAFTFRVDHPRRVYRYLEFYVGLRCRWLKLPYGDQAIFVKRKVFEEIGGYCDDFSLMEDVDLVRRLNQRNGFAILKFPVYTSARRFEADGYLRRALGNFYLQLLYALGVSPSKLAEKYWKKTVARS